MNSTLVFVLFNITLLAASLYLIFSGFVHFGLFLDLPIGLKILVAIGFVTPIMNLYDTIKNLSTLATDTETK